MDAPSAMFAGFVASPEKPTAPHVCLGHKTPAAARNSRDPESVSIGLGMKFRGDMVASRCPRWREPVPNFDTGGREGGRFSGKKQLTTLTTGVGLQFCAVTQKKKAPKGLWL